MMLPSGSSYYEFGSTASKVKYDVYKENAILRKKRTSIKYTRIKMRVVLLMLMMFGCGMVMMFRYAIITDTNYKIDDAKKNYNSIKNENITRRVKIENTLDLANVRDVALNKFGMHKPQIAQTVMVGVPKADYFKSNENLQDIEDKKNVVTFFSKMAKVVGLIR